MDSRHDKKILQEKPAIELSFYGCAFEGHVEQGYCLECLKCSHQLIGDTYERQVLGLIIICPVCRSVNATPERSRGEPVSSLAVVIKVGNYNFNNPVTTDRPVMIVSERTMQDYQKEVNFKQTEKDMNNVSETELNAHYLKNVAIKAIKLMDGHLYRQRLATHVKSAASKTPKSRSHRLIELIEYAQKLEKQLAKSGGVTSVIINGNLISELMSIVNMFERWQLHPASNALHRALSNSDDVQHSLMQMIVASYLADEGNGVSLVFKKAASKRIPDITVRPTLLETLQVEIKTPTKLHGPIEALTVSDATGIVKKALRAASTKRGQLDPAHAGILAICGFHLKQDIVDLLKKAVADTLHRQAKQKSHLAAVIICALTYEHTRIVGNKGSIINQSFRPITIFEIVRHPGYRGSLKLEIG